MNTGFIEFGLLGEKLGHSFSKEIHALLGDYSYELIEVPREELRSFISERKFSGLNVTIPYKETLIPYLDFLDDKARKIGAVNTIVNRGGKLYGYNTDFYGMEMLFAHAKIDPRGKTVAILGTGGTSKTAFAVMEHLEAKEIFKVSRSGADGALTYEGLYEAADKVDIIINTTPAGMFPDIDGCAVDLSKFKNLSGVIDAVYNPLRTSLIIEAKKRGIRAEGGLYMLVAQAALAAELFCGERIGLLKTEKVYRRILRDKENIVLIGMPASGKTTVGRILEKKLRRKAYDSDKLIEKAEKRTISDIFQNEGEATFRNMEADMIRSLSEKNGIVISTGGGAPLREENVDNLKKNGRLYFIDRPLGQLMPTKSRPLASSAEAIERRFNERYGIYSLAADVRIDADTSAPMTADKITKELYGVRR
jgi:shikimate dehydrogenase